MLRLTLLTLFVSFLAIYAWKDWYKSLCGLILLMAVVEHPDMPKTMLGIQGLNPWNLLLLVVFLAWRSARRKEGLIWDMPKGTQWLFIIYFFFIVLSFVRLELNLDKLIFAEQSLGGGAPSYLSLFSEYIVNCLKWLLPAIMLYDGCRDESRLRLGMLSLLFIYVLLAIQVIRWMPLSSIGGGEGLTERSLKILSNEVGYHRVNLSMMLSGASWALVCYSLMVKQAKHKKYMLICALIVIFGQALTGGRTGYATWVALSFVFAFFRWRKIFVVAPLAAMLLIATVPAVKERLLQGFDSESADTNKTLESTQNLGEGEISWYTVTAGRNIAWPYVIEKIGERPLLGYGRDAMKTQGITGFLWENFGESFPHPHNAYLQWLLDNGLFGFLPVIILFLTLLRKSLVLFNTKEHEIFVAVGGVSFALAFALLFASIGSQTFYPREGSVGMWCAIALMLRIFVQRKYLMKDDVNITREYIESNLWRKVKCETRKRRTY